MYLFIANRSFSCENDYYLRATTEGKPSCRNTLNLIFIAEIKSSNLLPTISGIVSEVCARF